MSIENSITELAAAIRMLAEGIAGAARSNAHGQIAAALGEAASAVAEVTKNTEVRGTTAEDAAADQIPGRKNRDAELEQAVAKVEADAKKNAGAADTATSTAADTAGPATGAASADLDYEKDVKPVLIAYSMATDKQTMTEYVKSFGVDKAPQLPKEKFAEVIAGAKERTAKAEAAKAA